MIDLGTIERDCRFEYASTIEDFAKSSRAHLTQLILGSDATSADVNKCIKIRDETDVAILICEQLQAGDPILLLPVSDGMQSSCLDYTPNGIVCYARRCQIELWLNIYPSADAEGVNIREPKARILRGTHALCLKTGRLVEKMLLSPDA